MNFCKNCKHWDNQNDKDICTVIDGEMVGACFQINKMLWNGEKKFHTINGVTHVHIEKSELPNYTLEHFSCNLFHKK